jgi:diketogulonate reductase-like aldo/keto reductase
MPSTTIPTLPLNTGHSIPQVGFGVFQVPSQDTEAAVTTALDAGYRHIDTAAAYGNEEEVGAAIAAAGIPREDLFVTTKLWNNDQGRDRARKAFEASLGKLGLDYVDLYLIHWPAPSNGLYVETWQTLVDIHREGLIRTPGVSNFEPEHLDRLAQESDVVPAVNQIELHPYLQQQELRRVHAERGIVTEAWSPLAQGKVLDDPAVKEIAERHGVDAGGIALAWSRQLGNVVLTKSVTPERIATNLEAALVDLSDEEMAAIAELDRGGRVGPDPNKLA